MSLEKLLTLKNVAEYLSVNPMTVRRCVSRGELPFVRLGDRLRFKPSDVEAHLAKHFGAKSAIEKRAEKAAKKDGRKCHPKQN